MGQRCLWIALCMAQKIRKNGQISYEHPFSFLFCPDLSPGMRQDVKISYFSILCPVPDFDRLSRPVPALGKILSPSLCPRTMKKLLSRCPEKLHCPVPLETLVTGDTLTLRISNLCYFLVALEDRKLKNDIPRSLRSRGHF